MMVGKKPHDEEQIIDPAIPFRIKVFLNVILVIVAGLSLFVLVGYALGIPFFQDPSSLGLNNIVLVCMFLMLVVNLPIRKFSISAGPLEISAELIEVVRTISRQEHTPVHRGDERRIDSPQQAPAAVVDTGVSQGYQPSNMKLAKLLIDFLTKYKRWYFNAPRIRNWGSKQIGFKALEDYSTSEIEVQLGEMLYHGIVVVRRGKKGSLIYKIQTGFQLNAVS